MHRRAPSVGKSGPGQPGVGNAMLGVNVRRRAGTSTELTKPADAAIGASPHSDAGRPSVSTLAAGVVVPPLPLPSPAPALVEADDLLKRLKSMIEAEEVSMPAQDIMLRDQVRELTTDVAELTDSLKATSIQLIQATREKTETQAVIDRLQQENQELNRLLRINTSRLHNSLWSGPQKQTPIALMSLSDNLAALASESTARSTPMSWTGRIAHVVARSLLAVASSSAVLFLLSAVALYAVCMSTHAPSSIFASSMSTHPHYSMAMCGQGDVLLEALHPRWSVLDAMRWKSLLEERGSDARGGATSGGDGSGGGEWRGEERGGHASLLRNIAIPLLCFFISAAWLRSIIIQRSSVHVAAAVARWIPTALKRAKMKAVLVKFLCSLLACVAVAWTFIMWLMFLVLVDTGVCPSASVLGTIRCAFLSSSTPTGLFIASLVAVTTLKSSTFGYFDALVSRISGLQVTKLNTEGNPLLRHAIYDTSLLISSWRNNAWNVVAGAILTIHSCFNMLACLAVAAAALSSRLPEVLFVLSAEKFGPLPSPLHSQPLPKINGINILPACCLYLVIFRVSILTMEFVHVQVAKRAVISDRNALVAHLITLPEPAPPSDAKDGDKGAAPHAAARDREQTDYLQLLEFYQADWTARQAAGFIQVLSTLVLHMLLIVCMRLVAMDVSWSQAAASPALWLVSLTAAALASPRG